jgi:predicted PurR-regulated permease PerM
MTLSPSLSLSLSWIALAAAGAALLWVLGPVLTPFVIAAVLAYVLHPLVEALVQRRLPRVAAVLLAEVLAVLAVLATLLLLVPVIARELPLLREQVPLLAGRINDALGPWLAQMGVELRIDTASLRELMARLFEGRPQDWAATLLESVRIGGSFVLTLIGYAVLIPVVLFFLLMDWPQLVARLHALIPPRLRERVVGFLDECDGVLGQYLRGQMLVMLSLAVFYTAALALAGFDLALPLGVFTGLAVLIPYIGFGLGLLLALLAALLEFGSWYGVVAVLVIYGVGQLLESFVLTPYLVGERIGMNPLAVIFALLAFGHLFGFIGVLVALPVGAVAVVALRRLRGLYVASRLYSG